MPDDPSTIYSTNDLRIISLADVSLHRWFEIGDPPQDYDAALLRLEQYLHAGQNSQHVRLLALKKNEVVARLAARKDDGGRFTFWWPSYLKGLSRSNRQFIGESLIQACINLATSDNRFRYLETKPADDVPDLQVWLASLKNRRFHMRSVAHLLYKRIAEPFSFSDGTINGIKVVRGDEVSLDLLEETFRAYQSDSRDRADSDPITDKTAAFRELLEETGSSQPKLFLWPVALVRNKPVGFAAVSVDTRFEARDLTGTILSIGVLPMLRRRGLGKVLLAEALNALKSYGAKAVQALVDDENRPSLALHQWAGFELMPERYMVYRRNLQ